MINYFQKVLHTAFSLYFGEGTEYADIRDISAPENSWYKSFVPEGQVVSFEESIIMLFALMPHISPQALDLFFLQNKELDRPHTEFGGWKGSSHSGFLPTGETAAFVLSVNRPEAREEVLRILSKAHWFYKNNILWLEGQGDGEPFLSGRLVVSDEVLAKVVHQNEYEPEYSPSFPAKKITTLLEWDDLVLPYNLVEELNSIITWLKYQNDILQQWNLNRIIKPGYRCLFYGPPGTGKTLTATLLGKQNGMDVYRVDLSMIVSKYIGETEKNLAKIFDKAQHRNWILFFDEADALFGQRTETQSSNDRHANQEVAYLLQRIEDFPGIVILATNLKENIDEAFFRRFQSALYFPVPDEHLRYELWYKMIPGEWLPVNAEEFIRSVAVHKLSGGSMVNVIQQCAIALYNKKIRVITYEIIKEAIDKELFKEGKMIAET